MKVRDTGDNVVHIYLSKEDMGKLNAAQVLGFDDKVFKKPFVKNGSTKYILGFESELDEKGVKK